MTEVSLVTIVMASALLFGSVEPWSLGLTGIITALAFIFFVARFRSTGTFDDRQARTVSICALSLLAYAVVQIVPLPVPITGLFHSRFSDLLTVSPGTPPAFHSISVYPYATEIEAARLSIYLMVFFMAVFAPGGDEGAGRVIRTLAVFGFLLTLFAIIQKATWNGKIYWFRELIQGSSPFGPFVNRNHFAGFIGMIIPLSLGMALRSRSHEKKITLGVLTLAMATGLFFSLSRGGVVAFLAAMSVFTFVVLTRGRSRKMLIPVSLFLLALAAYLLYLGLSPLMERFARTDIPHEERLRVWGGVLTAFRDFPLFGSGLGTFQHIFKAYQPDGLLSFYDHAHNDYLQLLLEGGILGFGVAAFFIVTVIRSIMAVEWEGRDLYLKAGLLSSLASIGVHSIFDFNLQIPSNAILFFLILGLAVSLSNARGVKGGT